MQHDVTLLCFLEKHNVPAKQPGLKMVAGPILSPSEQHVQPGLMADQKWFV